MAPYSPALMSRGKLVMVFLAWKGLCDKGYETVTGQAGLGSKAAALRTNSERPATSERASAPLPLLSPIQHLCLKGACDWCMTEAERNHWDIWLGRLTDQLIPFPKPHPTFCHKSLKSPQTRYQFEVALLRTPLCSLSLSSPPPLSSFLLLSPPRLLPMNL